MSQPTDEYFKNIIARRDHRFDGRFYFGVKTTGIYCRPVCPAKPKPENIVIFKSASEAERMGYRACLRCHPDLAPGSKFLDGTINTVSRGLRIINDSASDDLDVQRLAHSLGVTDRHLRRLFDQHLGASPIEIMITQRLHFAKQMIQETSKPITEIAFAVGFQSIRRFNEAFKSRYHKAPSAFRKARDIGSADVLRLKVPIRLPYDWATVLAYLKRHEAYGLEQIENGRYRRFIVRGNKAGSVVVSHNPGQEHLNVEFSGIALSDVRVVLCRIKNLFDTDHNPLHLPPENALVPQGIRVPGGFDPFETAVSIILSQLVSSERAKAALKKLILRYGRKIGVHDGQEVHEFPRPSVLAAGKVGTIGIPKARAQAIRELARAVLRGTLDFKSYDLAKTKEQLLAIHGVGPWTATMIAMRCLGDPDAFPEFDLIIQRALEKRLADHTDWISSRAYLTHCLWRDFSGTLSKMNQKEKKT
jgi:AraC family transcriptional regulator, regulatory protein of adaptative response / DNA-3-methyladenine glycosylase II